MTQHITHQSITLSSGRQVAAHIVGDPTAQKVVVACHPAPGSGQLDPDPAITEARGVALLAVDRPGYGGSEPRPAGEWSTVVGAAEDALAVLDSLGVGEFGVAGWSAGGRVAMALASLAPQRVARIAISGTPAPDDEVPWLTDEIRAGVDAMRGLSAADATAALQQQFSFASAEIGLDLLGASDADAAVLDDDEAAARVAAMLEESFRQGVAGMVADIAGYMLQPMGFDVADVSAKTLLIYGSADPVTGPKHGKWWQRQLPDARYEQVPGAGHLVFVQMWKRVLAHLAPSQ